MDLFDSYSQSTLNKVVEIRPGRNIWCKRVSIQLDTKEDNSADTCSASLKILFVHGSCAASSQYDTLIQEIRKSVVNGDYPLGEAEKNLTHIHCYHYDQLGCAKSEHPPSDWFSFSTSELVLDLQKIVQLITKGSEVAGNDSSPLFLVGHSHGCSQIIQLINNLPESDLPIIKGVVFMGGAVKGGLDEFVKDGGHWIFKYIPMFVLRKMQPSLSETFFNAAVHPINRDRLREEALKVSNSNDMQFCKAFYRQQIYASAEEALRVKMRALVIHGSDDLIFPLIAGEHLFLSLGNSEMITVPDTSHQVFEEEPKVVAETILRFFLKLELD